MTLAGKIFRFVSAALLSFLALTTAAAALAQGGYYGLEDTASAIGYTERKIEPIASRVVSGFLVLMAIIFFGIMLYAGLRWMTARGNEELRERAIHALQAAVIGLVIVIASYAITTLVFRSLGGGS